MPDLPNDFRLKLLATFRVEADEHVQAMTKALFAIERGAPQGEQHALIEEIFREAHSLKGAARAVNQPHVEGLCHSLESLFAAMQQRRVVPAGGILDLVHEALAALTKLLAQDPAAADPKAHTSSLVRRLDAASRGRGAETAGSPAALADATPAAPHDVAAIESSPRRPSQAPASATIRVRTEKIDSIMRQAEELLGPRVAGAQRLMDLGELRDLLTAWKQKRESVGLSRRSLERALANDEWDHAARSNVAHLFDYLEAESVLLKELDAGLGTLERASEADLRALGSLVDGLLRDVKETHMLPFSAILDAMPAVVRELSRHEGKEVELIVRGTEIEIDRRILDELKDPLHHLLRNAVAHGIESAPVRTRAGKPASGTIRAAVSQNGSKVEVAIGDDGGGIDVAAVRATAERLGVVSPDATLDERAALALMFQSGLSTSPTITEISGRGLGLAIVQEKVTRLGGAISVETSAGVGTVIRLELPLTLATFRGVLVRAAARTFVVPSSTVERVARVETGDIRTVENRETILLDGRATPLVWLSDVLEVPRASSAAEDRAHVIVVGTGIERIAFRVDEVLAEQEVLVKSLGRLLTGVRNIAAATVLGNGELVPVVNVADLVRSAIQFSGRTKGVEAPALEERRRSILVVEDSITSRTLLKNILEAAGYDVTTAVDGIDGYTALKSGAFDLVVSDVEMPRMDGFHLTMKIRADKELSRTPVVLVTALATREHRERGIDAGANAYIVKSSFDQSDLLGIIRRFV